MEYERHELRRAWLLKSLDNDWQDFIMLSRTYFEHLAHEFEHANVVNPLSWTEVKEAWIELKNIEELYMKFKDMVVNQEYAKALDFAENVLSNPDIIRVDPSPL